MTHPPWTSDAALHRDAAPVVLVTRADREPYLALAKTLHEEIRRHGIPCAIDETVYGGYSGQYKRHAIRQALRLNPGATVYWLDADTKLTNPALFLSLLLPRPRGIHAPFTQLLLNHVGWFYRGAVRAFLDRLWFERNIPVGTLWSSDPFRAFSLPPSDADRFFAEWDRLTLLLQVANVDVGDGVAVSLAATAANIPICQSIPLADVQASVDHFYQQAALAPHPRNWRGTRGAP
jgi:hypothetical protein